MTLDGFQYTFNGRGEFVLVETLDQFFQFQGRMIEPPGSSNSSTASGTSFSALAMKQNNSVLVQVEVASNDNVVILVDGEELDFGVLTEQQLRNVTIVNEGNGSYAVRFTSGISIQASNQNGILTNILVTIPEGFATRGLLGQFNGDPEDDLLPRNGTIPLPINSTVEDMHYRFGNTCKIILFHALMIIIEETIILVITPSAQVRKYVCVCHNNSQ